jgi:ABC-type oligopeptide transport system substrate-binding subunit
MKNKTNLKKVSWLLMIAFVTALALSACKSSSEHPHKEHPKKEHPGTNAPPRNP